jgi:hypothetical protein
MRNFYQLAFDGYVNGTAPVYSYSNLNQQLGRVDQLVIGGYTAQVSVSTGTANLTVQVEHSFDNFRWQNRNTAAEIPSTTSLSTAAETNVSGNDGDPTARPTLAFARLRIALGATGGGLNPAGQVRIWVTGRDRSEQ